MAMADRLPVFWEEELVGEVDRAGGGRMYFAYAASWLARDDARPISLSLPLGDGLYQEPAHNWFANLLPEGMAREAVARALGVAVDDDFGLLEALGRDVAGALSVGEPRDDRASEWLPLDEDDLDRWSTGAPALPDEAADGVRLSLAGAQHKIGARREVGRYVRTRGDAPSTHILKFGPSDLSHVPENEFFALELARALGLPVTRAELDLRWSRPVLVVERFDRVAEDGGVRRIHQEDLCQALGLSRLDKYRVTFAEVFACVRRASLSPARDSRTLLEWQSFNVLCGNDDGHAKNVSLTLDGGPRLAPSYDLVCTAAIDRLSRRLAMSVGGSDDSGNLTAEDWLAEDATLGLRAGAFRRVVEMQLDALPRALDAASESLARVLPDSPVLDRARGAISKRSKRVATGLKSPEPY